MKNDLKFGESERGRGDNFARARKQPDTTLSGASELAV